MNHSDHDPAGSTSPRLLMPCPADTGSLPPEERDEREKQPDQQRGERREHDEVAAAAFRSLVGVEIGGGARTGRCGRRRGTRCGPGRGRGWCGFGAGRRGARTRSRGRRGRPRRSCGHRRIRPIRGDRLGSACGRRGRLGRAALPDRVVDRERLPVGAGRHPHRVLAVAIPIPDFGEPAPAQAQALRLRTPAVR